MVEYLDVAARKRWVARHRRSACCSASPASTVSACSPRPQFLRLGLTSFCEVQPTNLAKPGTRRTRRPATLDAVHGVVHGKAPRDEAVLFLDCSCFCRPVFEELPDEPETQVPTRPRRLCTTYRARDGCHFRGLDPVVQAANQEFLKAGVELHGCTWAKARCAHGRSVPAERTAARAAPEPRLITGCAAPPEPRRRRSRTRSKLM